MHNFSTFFILVYAVEEGGFNFETTGITILYVELRRETAFSESYMAVSLIDVPKFAGESLEIKDRFMLFQRNEKRFKNS